MFCNNCGKEMSENAAFCPECGAKNEAVQQVVLEQPFDTAGKTNKLPTLKKIIAAVVVVVIVAAVGISFATGGRSSDKVIEQFIETTKNPNAEVRWELVPEEFHSSIVARYENEYGLYGEDEVLDYIQDDLENGYNQLAEIAGEDWESKFTYEITDEVVKDKSELRDINKKYREKGIEGFTADAAKTVTCSLTVVINGEEESSELSLNLIKIGRKWYMEPASIGLIMNDYYYESE